MKSYVSPLALALLAATVITAIIGFVLIPAGTTLPVHWGISGEPDGFAPREVALAMPIVILAIVWAIFLAIDRFAPKVQVERSRAMSRAALGMLSAICLCLAVVTVLIGTGIAVNMVQALSIGVGLLLIALGNAMPKSQPNSFAGLRTRTTLSDPANWQATHRVTGLLSVIGGAILVLAALVAPVGTLVFWILACVIVPVAAGLIYSHRFSATRRAP